MEFGMAENTQQSGDLTTDRFVLIRIEGMHCHKCEMSIKKNLQRHQGVHEVEVDFASGQASVLFNPASVSIQQLMEAVKESGYKPNGFTQSHADSPPGGAG
jgi:copper chaperone CopZ